jgi:hypothetical protein
MGKDKNRIQNPQQQQQMGTKGNLQQKQPAKGNLNPAQRQDVNRNLTNQKPVGAGGVGANMGGKGQPLKPQESWKDKNK